jgi:S-adenosylmethionine decarboxylase proenzyme
VYQAEGVHVMLDIQSGDSVLLNEPQYLLKIMAAAAEMVGATVLSRHYHRFEPNGVTAVLILSESHISIHTYPEKGVAFVDAFTCGSIDPMPAIEYIHRMLADAESGKSGQVRAVRRGKIEEAKL